MVALTPSQPCGDTKDQWLAWPLWARNHNSAAFTCVDQRLYVTTAIFTSVYLDL